MRIGLWLGPILDIRTFGSKHAGYGRGGVQPVLWGDELHSMPARREQSDRRLEISHVHRAAENEQDLHVLQQVTMPTWTRRRLG